MFKIRFSLSVMQMVAVVFLSASTACAQTYKEYVAQHKDLINLSISFPESKVTSVLKSDGSPLRFCFGLQDESGSLPVYCAAYHVVLNSRCILFLGSSCEKDLAAKNESCFNAVLLNNCDLPCTDWYSYADRKEDKINSTKSRCIMYIANRETLDRIGADNIRIVKFPNYKKVMPSAYPPLLLKNDDLGLYVQTQAYFDACVGIEVIKESQSFVLLAFVAETEDFKIEDCVELLSQYVKYDS